VSGFRRVPVGMFPCPSVASLLFSIENP